MHKKFVIIGIIVLIIIVGGCKKAPTDVQNLNVESNDAFPTSLDQLTSIVAGCYQNYRSIPLAGRDLLPGLASVGHESDDGGPLSDFDANSQLVYANLTSNNTYTTDVWSGFFAGVKNANSTLEAADFYQKNYAKPSDSTQINYIRGEAYFWRAWNYINLEGLFGQKYINVAASGDAAILGVPIYTEVVNSLAETQQPRATARQVWNFITGDLTHSAALLKGVAWPTVSEARVTDWSAKGMLGKAYVYTQNWDSAAMVLQDVILHGHGPQNLPLTLMPFSKYVQAFNAPANPGALNNYTAQKFNQESLVEIDVERVPGPNGNGVYGATPNLNLTTSQGNYWAPTGFVGTLGGSNNTASENKYSMGYSNMFVHDRSVLRFGFTIPVDSILTSTLIPNQNYNPRADTLKPAYLSTADVPGIWYTNTSNSLRNDKIADPRLYVCALEPYMDTVYFSYPSGQTPLKRPVAKCYEAPTDLYLGWSFKKYQTLDSKLVDVNGSDGADYYLLRLADVYLLYAEARLNIGGVNDMEGLKYLNFVHQRAYDNYTNSTEHDYASFVAPTKADPSDLNLTNNPLAYERYAELFAEGNWWFDVCRWGNSNGASGMLYNTNFGLNESAYYGNMLPNNLPITWNNNAYSFPIPITELNANSQMRLQANGGQNLGY